MTLQALDERLVAETLAQLRAEAAANETASRLYRACEQAVTGRYAGFARLPVETHLRLVRRCSRG